MDIQQKQNTLKTGKNILDLTLEELRYTEKPIGKAIYKEALEEKCTPRGRGRPKKWVKANPTDRLICNICVNKFIRRNRFSHNQTKQHQLYVKIDDKFRRLIIEMGHEDKSK
jgi:hypothetical protein